MSSTRTQQITPQLRAWIVEQAQAGHGPEAVVKSMIASGWTEDVAVEAMETTLRGHLDEQAVQQGLPPALPVLPSTPIASPRRTACPVVLTWSFSIQPSNFGLTTARYRSSNCTVPTARTVRATTRAATVSVRTPNV